MALTYTKANQLLNQLNGRGSTIYIGLSLDAPNRDGTGVREPSTNAGYKRMRLQSSQMSEPQNGVTTNVETIYFAEATAQWGVCTYFCLFGGGTVGGNDLLAYGALPQSIAPTDQQVARIRTGNLTMSM